MVPKLALDLHKLGGIVGHEREPPDARLAAALRQLPRAHPIFAGHVGDTRSWRETLSHNPALQLF